MSDGSFRTCSLKLISLAGLFSCLLRSPQQRMADIQPSIFPLYIRSPPPFQSIKKAENVHHCAVCEHKV